MKIFDEDDVAIFAGKREVPGILICLRRVDSTASGGAQQFEQGDELLDHLSQENSRPNLLGIDCVKGSGTGLDTPARHYLDDHDYSARSQPPSLSVSALGREVEAMGTRIAHWSAARPARPRTSTATA